MKGFFHSKAVLFDAMFVLLGVFIGIFSASNNELLIYQGITAGIIIFCCFELIKNLPHKKKEE